MKKILNMILLSSISIVLVLIMSWRVSVIDNVDNNPLANNSNENYYSYN